MDPRFAHSPACSSYTGHHHHILRSALFMLCYPSPLCVVLSHSVLRQNSMQCSGILSYAADDICTNYIVPYGLGQDSNTVNHGILRYDSTWYRMVGFRVLCSSERFSSRIKNKGSTHCVQSTKKIDRMIFLFRFEMYCTRGSSPKICFRPLLQWLRFRLGAWTNWGALICCG